MAKSTPLFADLSRSGDDSWPSLLSPGKGTIWMAMEKEDGFRHPAEPDVQRHKKIRAEPG
jgi:hypothetical protein